MIDQSIIFNKLSYYGLNGSNFIAVIQVNYFQNTKQLIGIKLINSDIWPIIVGIPQGLIFWQLLFIIYIINDYPQPIIYFYFVMYAGATAICRIWYPLAAMHTIKDLKVNDWIHIHELALNKFKSKYTIRNARKFLCLKLIK